MSAGKKVTIHDDAINYYGWHGHRYIVADTVTGAGAYKISGGYNGNQTSDDGESIELTSLFGLLDGLLSQSDSKFAKIASDLLGIVDVIINALDAAKHCKTGFAAFTMSAIYFLGGVGWTALSAVFIPISVFLALALFLAGVVLFAAMWAVDIQHCER